MSEWLNRIHQTSCRRPHRMQREQRVAGRALPHFAQIVVLDTVVVLWDGIGQPECPGLAERAFRARGEHPAARLWDVQLGVAMTETDVNIYIFIKGGKNNASRTEKQAIEGVKASSLLYTGERLGSVCRHRALAWIRLPPAGGRVASGRGERPL